MSQERRVDLEEIRALIQLATEADITELDVDAPHVKVRIKKAARNSVERVAAVVPRTDGAIPEAAARRRTAARSGRFSSARILVMTR